MGMNLVKDNLNLFTRLRGGLLRLRVNTGRWGWEGTLLYEERVCTYCNRKEIEDEFHVLFMCPVWSSFRKPLEKKYIEYRRKDLCSVLATTNKSLVDDICKFSRSVLIMRDEMEEVLS